MNLKSSNKIGPNRHELEIEIGSEEFSKAIDKAYRKNVKKISIPGFRKGKAPKAFIEKYYGEKIFYEDAINDVYPDALDQAIKEAKLDVINDKIDFDIVTASPKDGLVFKVALTVKPEVKIENYKGIEVNVKPIEVTDEDIDKEIERQRQKVARFVEISNRPAKDGDIVVIDYKGFIDGVAFEGGEGKNHNLKLGSKQFIPGFEEQIIGHNKDEEFSINVEFPKDYGVSSLAGKAAVFEIKIHEIKECQLPSLDDEFVKDVSEFDTLSEYKEDIRKKITQDKQEISKNDMDDQIIDKVNELLEAEIPEAMFENKIDEDIKEFDYRLRSQGLNINDYIKYTGLNKDSFRKEFRPAAERQVKLRLALEEIAKIEKLKPSEKEITDKYKEYSDLYKLDLEKVKAYIPEENLAMDLSCEKALEFLRQNVKSV